MIDLSLHLLDLMQNSAHAGATKVDVLIEENVPESVLKVVVADNGHGMDELETKRVLDPYYSSRNKKTGLGLPLVAQAAQMAGGELSIESEMGKGTQVTVTFGLSHVDRQPLGDVPSTIVSFVAGNPCVDVSLHYRGPSGEYCFESSKVRNAPNVSSQIAFLIQVEEEIRDGLAKAGFRPDKGGVRIEEY
jgi:hypothetical protein